MFFPEGAFGPTNNCVGIGQVLRDRGHRVVFVVEESFAGTLEAKGFEEALMRLGPPPEVPEVPGQFWKDFIRDTAPVFRTPTIDQLGAFLQPTWQALIDGSKYVEPRLREIFADLKPGRDRAGQRRGLPGRRDGRRAVGTDHVLQPARDARPRPPAGVLRVSERRSDGLGRVRGRARPDAPRDVAGLRRLRLPRLGGSRRVAGAAVHVRVAVPEPVAVSEGSRLRTRRGAGADLAPAGLVRPRAPTPSSTGRKGSNPTGRTPTRSCTSRSARWVRPTST